MPTLTFALAKGRLADEAMALLNKAGYDCSCFDNSRKLIYTNNDQDFSFFLSKPSDVPTYVEYGCADIGIAGKDTLLEENRNVYEVLDLGTGKCSIVVAGKEEMRERLHNINNLRVATKFPAIAMDYFNNTMGRTVEIIKLNGSVELAPIVGLADVIVDLVATGATLAENGLQVLETITPSISARVIVNRVAMKVKNERITEIIRRLRDL